MNNRTAQLIKLFKSSESDKIKNRASDNSEKKNTLYLALEPKDLLSSDQNQKLLRQIKRAFSITEEVWNNHYLYAFNQTAALVQLLPASQIHHHSQRGGLLLHTLEAAHNCVRISQGYVLPPNRPPEEISASTDKWRFGALIATLCHDLGKLVTDIEVVHRPKDNENFERWYPWYGPIPVGHEYTFRYRDKVKNTAASKALHEKASMSLLPNILTKQAVDWLFSDLELISEVFSTISHSTVGGKTIAEIVRKSDQYSVSHSLGAETGKDLDHTSSIPLHEKILTALRSLVNEGILVRNKPGAAVWVTESETWIVSKASMEAVQQQLISEGHKGIPRNPVRLFDILREHELIKPNPQGDSIWYGLVKYEPTSWQQKLTFLRFENHVIWPTSNPEKLRGSVIPVTKEGVEIEDSLKKIPGKDEDGDFNNRVNRSHGEEATQDKAKAFEQSSSNVTVVKEVKVLCGLDKNEDSNLIKYESYVSRKGKHRTKSISNSECDQERGGKLVKPAKKESIARSKASQKKQQAIDDNNFFKWLVANVKGRKLKCNEKKAAVHILDRHVAIVTPSIFQKYLNEQTTEGIKYDRLAGEQRMGYTVLQKEIEALDINTKAENGQNIVNVKVAGEKRTARLSVYLLEKVYFPELAHINVNRAISRL